MGELIKVSAQSRSTAVAGAIAGVMREHGYAEIQAIGASAINQAIKAVTIARGYLVQDQMDLAGVPSFTDVGIDGATPVVEDYRTPRGQFSGKIGKVTVSVH